MKTSQQGDNKRKTAASVAGAGAGTLLMAIFTSLSDETQSKKWLILSVPTLTVIISQAALFVGEQIKSWWNQKQISKEKQQLGRIIEEQLSDPNTSEEHKAEVRKAGEELKKIELQNQMQKVKGLYVGIRTPQLRQNKSGKE